MVLCRREGANADIESNIRVETANGRERIRDCRVFESVELKRGWTVGFYGHFPVVDFDTYRLGVVAKMFQKVGWSEC